MGKRPASYNSAPDTHVNELHTWLLHHKCLYKLHAQRYHRSMTYAYVLLPAASTTCSDVCKWACAVSRRRRYFRFSSKSRHKSGKLHALTTALTTVPSRQLLKRMEVTYVYTKKRAEFGRQCNFSDKPAEIGADLIPEPQQRVHFIDRNPCDLALQCSFEFSEHEVSAGSSCSMIVTNEVRCVLCFLIV